MLKTKVKASSVTNLTDARYFAAWEVEWLGFNFGPGSDTYIQPQVMKAIKEWVDGVKIVGEFSLQPAEEILEAADMLELEAVQLGMFTDVETLRKLQAQEVPVLLEIIVESPEKLAGIYNRLKGEAPFVEAFLLNFDKNDIGWGALSDERRQQLHTLCRDYRVILSMDFRAGTLEEALDLVQPYGINVRGGAEERVGFKSFDELDELFEALEIYE